MPKRLALLILIGLLSLPLSVLAGIAISSARVWPAQEYTRITLESPHPIRYSLLTLKDPERLVIDLENVEITPALNGLAEKIGTNDPYIQSVRIGRFKPDVVRLVLDLKGAAKPQLFSLKPVGEYGHRLVLDVYPAEPHDPLLALAQQFTAPPTPASSVAASAPAPAATKAASKEEKAPRHELSTHVLTIAIDAGHGGEDPGAQGRRGTHEKDVTLAIARRLKAQIDATPGLRAVLIRDGDYFIPLMGRVEKARQIRADLFISIHADAFIKPHARGSSVFALSERGATSASARWLAKKENEADLIGGVNLDVSDPYLARTLLDLSQTATINDSLKLAKHVLGELGNVNTLHRGHVEQAGFAVLKSPDIPSILVETAFISNPEEELRLRSEAYQDKLARAILAGIQRYVARNPALARQRLAQSR